MFFVSYLFGVLVVSLVVMEEFLVYMILMRMENLMTIATPIQIMFVKK